MDENTEVSKTNLKRKLDENDGSASPGLDTPDNIELSLPDPDIAVSKLEELDLQNTESAQDEPVLEIPDMELVSMKISSTENDPSQSSEPNIVTSDENTSGPVTLLDTQPSLPMEENSGLPSLDAISSDAPPKIVESSVTSGDQSTSLDISISTPVSKQVLPLSVGPSDEALISECEKLLEENREFEKSHDIDDDNDDQNQDSSDTVSVDSDTAKAQEEDFRNEPMDIDQTKVVPSPIKQEDPLSTLASAALSVKPTSISKPLPKDLKKKILNQWCDVGIFGTPSCVVNGFYTSSDNDSTNHEYSNVTINNLPSFDNMVKQNLEPGTAYKFRVCAVNSCGRGPWSEVSAFRTCVPGYPGAPSSIKISKSPDGANISWLPPQSPSGEIVEYSVCLAVKKYNQRNEEIKPNPTALTFDKVYSGPSNQAVISHNALTNAYIDTTHKPAIIFRIAAANEKGYGPATQVRWLQDVYFSKK